MSIAYVSYSTWAILKRSHVIVPTDNRDVWFGIASHNSLQQIRGTEHTAESILVDQGCD